MNLMNYRILIAFFIAFLFSGTAFSLEGDLSFDGCLNQEDIDLLEGYVLETADLTNAPQLQKDNADLTNDGLWNIFDIQTLINLVNAEGSDVCEPLPNFRVNQFSIPLEIVENQPFQITVTIENFSSADVAGPIPVDLEIGNQLLQANCNTSNFDIGETCDVVFNVSGLTEGFYTYTAVIDPENTITETDTTDNASIRSLNVAVQSGSSNLIIDGVAFTPHYFSANNEVLAEVTLRNAGLGQTREVPTLQFSLDGSVLYDRLQCGTEVLELETGDSFQVRGKIGTEFNDKLYTVTVGNIESPGAGYSAELSLSGNTGVIDSHLVRAGDLVRFVSRTGKQVNENSILVKSVGLKNGTETITLIVGGDDVLPLGSTCTSMLVIPASKITLGQHYYSVTADPDNEERETIEYDNEYVSRFTVNESLPDLALSIDYPASNQVRVTIQNNSFYSFMDNIYVAALLGNFQETALEEVSDTCTAGGLASFATCTKLYEYPAGIDPGWATLTIEVDPFNQIPESNELNNSYYNIVEIQ